MSAEVTIDTFVLGSHVTLKKDIAAIAVQFTDTGAPQLGVISHLPKGAEVHVCGGGFNARTVRVDYLGMQYFVFLQDVETSSENDCE